MIGRFFLGESFYFYLKHTHFLKKDVLGDFLKLRCFLDQMVNRKKQQQFLVKEKLENDDY